MRTPLAFLALFVICVTACRRDAPDPAAASEAPETPVAATVTLTRASIAPDGSPVEISSAGPATAPAGQDIAVEGSLQLDPEADFSPPPVVVKITGTTRDGRTITMDSGIVKPRQESRGTYSFRSVLTAPKKGGTYRIVARLAEEEVSEGSLQVTE